MATSDIDPRLLALLDQLGRQAKKGAAPGAEQPTAMPFGMAGGPGLDVLRSMYTGPSPQNLVGTPPVVGGPERRVSGAEEATTPSRAPRLPDLNPARQLALGAMPNSSITPEVVRQALGIEAPSSPSETIDYGKAPRQQAADTGDEAGLPRVGGFQPQSLQAQPAAMAPNFPEIRAAAIPSLMDSFPEMQAARIPEMQIMKPAEMMGGGFQSMPVIQGAPKMPEMGFPSAQGGGAEAPRMTSAGLMAEPTVPLLPAGAMPGMPSMATPNFSGLGEGGGGGGGGGGGAGTGLRGIGTGTGTSSHPLASTIASLLPGLLKSLPLDAIKSLLGGSLGNLGPAGTVTGDPYGTGASANTTSDILRPTYENYGPSEEMGPFSDMELNDYLNNLDVGPSMDIGMPDISASDFVDTGDILDNFDWGDFF